MLLAMADIIQPADNPGPGGLRASDADREKAVEILREAAGDGRIGLEELDERLEAVYAARTHAEIEPVVRDLQSAATAAGVPAATSWVGGTPTSARAVAIMSGFERKGTWVVPRRFSAFTFFGGGTIDLREARFAAPEVTIRVTAVMGGVEVIVPEGVDVYSSGVGLLGGFQDLSATAAVPGAPRVRVTGLALLGGVGVERQPSQLERKQRKLERRQAKLERRQAKLDRAKDPQE
jgi:DUF1707 SHOCT-like domain